MFRLMGKEERVGKGVRVLPEQQQPGNAVAEWIAGIVAAGSAGVQRLSDMVEPAEPLEPDDEIGCGEGAEFFIEGSCAFEERAPDKDRAGAKRFCQITGSIRVQ